MLNEYYSAYLFFTNSSWEFVGCPCFDLIFQFWKRLYFLMHLGIIFDIFRAKTFTCLYSWFTRFPNVVWFFYKMEIIIHYFSWYSIFLTWKSQLQEFGRLLVYTSFAITLQMLNHGDFLYTSCNPVHTGRKLNVHKTYILYTFDLRPVSTGKPLGWFHVDCVPYFLLWNI